jgi:hypothetical protein
VPPECQLKLSKLTLKRLATMGISSPPLARNAQETVRDIGARRLADEEARLSLEQRALEDTRAAQEEARAREERELTTRREWIAAEEARLNADRQQIERERAELAHERADASENITTPDSIEPDWEQQQQIEKERAELAHERADASENITTPDSIEPDWEMIRVMTRFAELSRVRGKWWPRFKAMVAERFVRRKSPLLPDRLESDDPDSTGD